MAIQQYVPGWPVIERQPPVDQPLPNASTMETSFLAHLLERGILLPERRRGKEATPPCMARPRVPLLDEYEIHITNVTWSDISRFIRAAASAAALLRRLRSGLQEKCTRDGTQAIDEAKLSAMRRVLAVYLRLRPFLWKSKAQESFERATLLQFFNYYGFHPSWVFGVAIDPLTTWSWLQIDDIVIDGSVGYASTFTPIRTVSLA